jgi:hypothetical protein
MGERYYSKHEEPTGAQVEEALRRDRPDEVKRVVIGLALHSMDGAFVEQLCRRLATHGNEEVRGNAILGFGHLARRFRRLSPEARGLIQQGLSDTSEYVRGQAHAAADDADFFLSTEE